MIIVKKRNGETIILGTDQEKLLQRVIQFAIDEGELHDERIMLQETKNRLRRLKEVFS